MSTVDIELIVFSQPDNESVELRNDYMERLMASDHVPKTVSYPNDKWEFTVSTSRGKVNVYMEGALTTNISQSRKGKSTQIAFVYPRSQPEVAARVSNLLTHLSKSSPVYVIAITDSLHTWMSNRHYTDTLGIGGGIQLLLAICKHALSNNSLFLSEALVETEKVAVDKEWLTDVIKKLQVLHDSL